MGRLAFAPVFFQTHIQLPLLILLARTCTSSHVHTPWTYRETICSNQYTVLPYTYQMLFLLSLSTRESSFLELSNFSSQTGQDEYDETEGMTRTHSIGNTTNEQERQEEQPAVYVHIYTRTSVLFFSLPLKKENSSLHPALPRIALYNGRDERQRHERRRNETNTSVLRFRRLGYLSFFSLKPPTVSDTRFLSSLSSLNDADAALLMMNSKREEPSGSRETIVTQEDRKG